MFDEFHDDQGNLPAAAQAIEDRSAASRQQRVVARLLSRFYRASNPQVRAAMLSSLVRPLGLLSLVGVASGAFGCLLQRDGRFTGPVSPTDTLPYTPEQVGDLASFVHEVDPVVLQQLVEQLAQTTVGMTALSAAVLVILHRTLRIGSSSDNGHREV